MVSSVTSNKKFLTQFQWPWVLEIWLANSTYCSTGVEHLLRDVKDATISTLATEVWTIWRTLDTGVFVNSVCVVSVNSCWVVAKIFFYCFVIPIACDHTLEIGIGGRQACCVERFGSTVEGDPCLSRACSGGQATFESWNFVPLASKPLQNL